MIENRRRGPRIERASKEQRMRDFYNTLFEKRDSNSRRNEGGY